MARLEIDEALGRALVRDMAPAVVQITGWPLGIDRLRIRVVPKNQGYECVLLGRLRGAGIPISEDQRRSLLDRFLEYVVEGVLLSAYEPSTGELFLVRENLDEGNMDGLRLIVAHELVHRAQHLRHPELSERIDCVLRGVCARAMRGDLGLGELATAVRRVEPVMSLLESHAQYVQEDLRQKRFPNARIESQWNVAAVLLRLFGGPKVSQYTRAVPAVAKSTADNLTPSTGRPLG